MNLRLGYLDSAGQAAVHPRCFRRILTLLTKLPEGLFSWTCPYVDTVN